jgi:hypothetical protein
MLGGVALQSIRHRLIDWKNKAVEQAIQHIRHQQHQEREAHRAALEEQRKEEEATQRLQTGALCELWEICIRLAFSLDGTPLDATITNTIQRIVCERDLEHFTTFGLPLPTAPMLPEFLPFTLELQSIERCLKHLSSTHMEEPEQVRTDEILWLYHWIQELSTRSQRHLQLVRAGKGTVDKTVQQSVAQVAQTMNDEYHEELSVTVMTIETETFSPKEEGTTPQETLLGTWGHLWQEVMELAEAVQHAEPFATEVATITRALSATLAGSALTQETMAIYRNWIATVQEYWHTVRHQRHTSTQPLQHIRRTNLQGVFADLRNLCEALRTFGPRTGLLTTCEGMLILLQNMLETNTIPVDALEAYLPALRITILLVLFAIDREAMGTALPAPAPRTQEVSVFALPYTI